MCVILRMKIAPVHTFTLYETDTEKQLSVFTTYVYHFYPLSLLGICDRDLYVSSSRAIKFINH